MARILIAEHNKTTANYLAAALKKAGNKVCVVDNCLDAWRASSKESFEVLVVDVVMPGVDGFVLAQRALQENPLLQIIFVTGFSGVAMDIQATPNYAPAPVTTSPFHLRHIANQVRYLMGFGSSPAKRPAAAGSVIYADFSRKDAAQQHMSS